MTIRFPRGVYRVLLVDLGILLLDSAVCLWTSLAGQVIGWWLPAAMVGLVAALLLVVMFQAFN